MIFVQGALYFPFALCPANCVSGTGAGILPGMGRVLTALNHRPCPHQTTDVPILGALTLRA